MLLLLSSPFCSLSNLEDNLAKQLLKKNLENGGSRRGSLLSQKSFSKRNSISVVVEQQTQEDGVEASEGSIIDG